MRKPTQTPTHYALLLVISLINVSWFSSCDLINPEEEIPVYIFVDSVSTEMNVRDVWVYQSYYLQGVYELPAKFPLIHGTGNIQVRGGIFADGLSSLRIPYPLWTIQETGSGVNAGGTDTILLTVVYLDSVKFSLNESFDSTGVRLISTSKSDTTLQVTPGGFGNSKSGIIYLDSARTYFEIVNDSQLNFSLPVQNVWAEVVFKSDVYFKVGILAESSTGVSTISNFGAKSSPERWNKIYFNLSEEINASGQGAKIKFWMEGKGDGSVQKVMFDNIRIVHF